MIVRGKALAVPADLNFSKYLLDRLRKTNPDDTAWMNCTSGESLTYGALTQRVVSVGAALVQRGVAGGVVAVASEPRAAHITAALAVVMTGAAYTPLELTSGRAVVQHYLNLSKPEYIICSRLFREAYSDILQGFDFKAVIDFDEIDATRRDTTFEAAAVDGDDVVVVVYSSGTTGKSKGVLLTHRNFICAMSEPVRKLESLKTFLLSTRIAGLHDIYYTFYLLSLGKTIIFSETGVDLKMLQDYQVNVVPTHPGTLKNMAEAENIDDYDLSSLKMVCSSGDRLHSNTVQSFTKRYPQVNLLQCYGSSETGMMTTLNITSSTVPDIETVTPIGFAIPGVSLKVVDVETREPLGPYQRGEICAQTPGMMKGYLGPAPRLDEGFYPTGDLGYYDDNKLFYFVDRLKDVINYNGIKVAPMELEAVLLAHPAVRSAAVVGRPGVGGEVPAAAVVLQPGASVKETELVDYVAREVSSHMRLRGGVMFVSEIPTSANRKTLRRRLKEMFEEPH